MHEIHRRRRTRWLFIASTLVVLTGAIAVYGHLENPLTWDERTAYTYYFGTSSGSGIEVIIQEGVYITFPMPCQPNFNSPTEHIESIVHQPLFAFNIATPLETTNSNIHPCEHQQ